MRKELAGDYHRELAREGKRMGFDMSLGSVPNGVTYKVRIIVKANDKVVFDDTVTTIEGYRNIVEVNNVKKYGFVVSRPKAAPGEPEASDMHYFGFYFEYVYDQAGRYYLPIMTSQRFLNFQDPFVIVGSSGGSNGANGFDYEFRITRYSPASTQPTTISTQPPAWLDSPSKVPTTTAANASEEQPLGGMSPTLPAGFDLKAVDASSDSRYVAVQGLVKNQSRLYLLDIKKQATIDVSSLLDGKDITGFERDDLGLFMPTFSPDARRLVFGVFFPSTLEVSNDDRVVSPVPCKPHSDGPRLMTAFVLDLEKRSCRPIVDTNAIVNVHWDADKIIICREDKSGEVWERYSADGEFEKVVTRPASTQPTKQ